METKPEIPPLYSCDVITLNEETEPAIYEYFLDRPRKLKYDEYHGKWYKINWSAKAIQERLERRNELKRQKYKEIHPQKEKNGLTWYLKHKMGISQNPVGRPKKNQ